MDEKEYKLDLFEGKIIINEDLKESKDHQTNIFYIKTSFDLGTVFKIHYDKIKLDWDKIKEIYIKNNDNYDTLCPKKKYNHFFIRYKNIYSTIKRKSKF